MGPEGVLTRYLRAGRLPSVVLWGPPGVGKTTLAHLLAQAVGKPFVQLSAISAGVKELREVIAAAENRPGGTVLFIDEIHRFNKAQQDALLGAVERGVFSHNSATTENPSFEVIPALLSRAQVYVLEPLAVDDLRELIRRALTEDEQLSRTAVRLESDDALLRISGGDARRLLNLLEIVVEAAAAEAAPGAEVVLTDATVEALAQRNLARYDKGGEAHYDVISAFIKSIRGSDPNAALYYLAVMLEGGEDPKFIARRLLISASEDIGNANPTALPLAAACWDGVQAVGLPECDLILAQTTIYLATSAKSNAAYTAIRGLRERVRREGPQPVPLGLRNAPTRLLKQLGYGQTYQYAHDSPGNFVVQDYLPDTLSGTRFYDPGDNPREAELRARLRGWWGERYGY